MKLHRSTGKPDWANVAKKRQNVWQRIAAASQGYLTPSNVVTIAGFAIVLRGLLEVTRHHYFVAMVALVIGRLSDIVDGWLAEKMQTKSPLGELLDASIDKLSTGLTVVVFYVCHVASGWLLLTLLLPHLLISVIALRAKHRRQTLHPSRAGKISMAAAWLSLLGLLLLKTPYLHTAAFVSVVSAAAAVSICLGLYATIGYVSDTKTKIAKNHTD